MLVELLRNVDVSQHWLQLHLEITACVGPGHEEAARCKTNHVAYFKISWSCGLLRLDPSVCGAQYTWGLNKVLVDTSHIFVFRHFNFLCITRRTLILRVLYCVHRNFLHTD